MTDVSISSPDPSKGDPVFGTHVMFVWLPSLDAESFVDASLTIGRMMVRLDGSEGLCLVVGWPPALNWREAMYDGAMGGLVRSAAKEAARIKAMAVGLRGDEASVRRHLTLIEESDAVFALSGSVLSVQRMEM